MGGAGEAKAEAGALARSLQGRGAIHELLQFHRAKWSTPAFLGWFWHLLLCLVDFLWPCYFQIKLDRSQKTKQQLGSIVL